MLAVSNQESAISMDQISKDDGYWRAVQDKDAAFDGVFFVAVTSTRVYCRPICPSRQPRRDRVRFFETPREAEAAGFRACLRCEPRRMGPSRRELIVQEACRLLDREQDETVTLAALGKRLKVSPYHLQRTFKRVVGVTPAQYMKARRLGKLKEQLRDGETVTRAMYDAGYGSSSRLYEDAGLRLGMTPGTYGRRGHGMRIAYVMTDSPLGRLLVAATERGICSVRLGDSDEELEAALRGEYSAAEIVDWGGAGREGLALWADLVRRQLEGERPAVDLPVDVIATAFQSKVWQALRAIPYGSTRSYGEIALEIGQPTAQRAVAQACATNPVAIVIPCHRVVQSDGGLGGYGLGVPRKKRLLEMEKAEIVNRR